MKLDLVPATFCCSLFLLSNACNRSDPPVSAVEKFRQGVTLLRADVEGGATVAEFYKDRAALDILWEANQDQLAPRNFGACKKDYATLQQDMNILRASLEYNATASNPGVLAQIQKDISNEREIVALDGRTLLGDLN
jgi:hypothetical protein